MEYREAFRVLNRQVGEIDAIDAHTHINAGPAERDIYASYLFERLLQELEKEYAKSILVRTETAKALAYRAERGQYTLEGVAEIARRLLRQTPEHLLGLSQYHKSRE